MKNSTVIRLLLLLSCAVVTPSDAAQVTVGFDEPHNPVTMSVPDKTVALQIDLLHLKLEQNQLDESATRRKVDASDGRGWELTAFIYPLEKK